MTRREAREQAFVVLFEKIFDNDATISEIVATAKEAELIKINSFAENSLNGFLCQNRDIGDKNV